MDRVKQLLQDPEFCSISAEGAPGTILIQAPYRTAVRQYADEAKKWPKEWQERVQVLTVDRAQGNQADVVFLDMVRTGSVGFMDDPKRLNVAITRARQGEVILMHSRMTWRLVLGRRVKTTYTAQIWDDAVAGHRLLSV